MVSFVDSSYEGMKQQCKNRSIDLLWLEVAVGKLAFFVMEGSIDGYGFSNFCGGVIFSNIGR